MVTHADLIRKINSMVSDLRDFSRESNLPYHYSIFDSFFSEHIEDLFQFEKIVDSAEIEMIQILNFDKDKLFERVTLNKIKKFKAQNALEASQKTLDLENYAKIAAKKQAVFKKQLLTLVDLLIQLRFNLHMTRIDLVHLKLSQLEPTEHVTLAKTRLQQAKSNFNQQQLSESHHLYESYKHEYQYALQQSHLALEYAHIHDEIPEDKVQTYFSAQKELHLLEDNHRYFEAHRKAHQTEEVSRFWHRSKLVNLGVIAGALILGAAAVSTAPLAAAVGLTAGGVLIGMQAKEPLKKIAKESTLKKKFKKAKALFKKNTQDASGWKRIAKVGVTALGVTAVLVGLTIAATTPVGIGLLVLGGSAAAVGIGLKIKDEIKHKRDKRHAKNIITEHNSEYQSLKHLDPHNTDAITLGLLHGRTRESSMHSYDEDAAQGAAVEQRRSKPISKKISTPAKATIEKPSGNKTKPSSFRR